MQGGFNRILALVDFSKASFHAAEEAALIASKFESELHLLHISNSNSSHLIAQVFLFDVAGDEEKSYYENVDKLEKIKTDLHKRYSVNISCHVVFGEICQMINRYSDALNINLVVLGAGKENWFKELFFESKAKRIIRSVNSEVLCVYPESNSNRLKKIVLPIEKYIPKRKIRLAYELAKKFAANVHLISLDKNGNGLNKENTKVLMASYQFLKDITNIPIECRTVLGNNLAQSTVQYAENIEADIILIDAGSESFFRGDVLRRWGGNIVNHSSIPVLSVQAINDNSKRKQYRRNLMWQKY